MRFPPPAAALMLVLAASLPAACSRNEIPASFVQTTAGPTAAPVGIGAPGSVPACRSVLSSVPDPRGAHGLFVWIDSLVLTNKQPAILRYALPDPNLCGASILVLWSEVDRGPAASPQYDFSTVESAIRPWASAGKLVNLLFVNVNETGKIDSATPAWVLAQTGSNRVDTVACPDPGTGQSTGPPTPVYWERGFEQPYRAFIKAAISQYGSDSRIGYMRFGVGPGAEDFVQHGADGACFANWKPYGLSARSWADYSASQVRYVASLHSKAQQLVALNQFDDQSAPYDVPQAVASAAAASGVGFGTENLGSGPSVGASTTCASQSPPPYWCAPFDEYAGDVPLQFQTISYTLDPSYSHLPQLPVLLAYAIHNRAQIFELYPEDWLTADDPSYDGYAAHHAAWSKALASAAATLGGSP